MLRASMDGRVPKPLPVGESGDFLRFVRKADAPALNKGPTRTHHFHSFAFGKYFHASVSQEKLIAATWPEQMENPPLSARRAIDLAEGFRKGIEDRFKVAGWDRFKVAGWDEEYERKRGVALVPKGDSWHWQIDFAWCPWQ